MRRLISVIVNEFKRYEYRFFIVFLAVFFLFAGIVFFQQYSSLSVDVPDDGVSDTDNIIHFSLGVCDNDKSMFSPIVIAYFKSNDVFTKYVSIVEDTEEQLSESISEGGIDAYIVIPEGFSESLMYIDNMPLKVVISSTDVTKAVILKSILESYETYIASVEANCVKLDTILFEEGYDYELRSEVNESISYSLILTALSKEGYFDIIDIEEESTNLLSYYVLNIVFFVIFFMMIPGGFGLRNQIAEKTADRMYMCGISDGVAVGAKLFVNCFFEIIFALMMLLATNIVSLHSNPEVLLFLCLVIFNVNLIILLIGVASNSDKTYMLTIGLLFIIMITAGGGIVPVMYLSEEFTAVAKFMPNYFFTEYFLGKVPMPSVFILLISFTVLFFITVQWYKIRARRRC